MSHQDGSANDPPNLADPPPEAGLTSVQSVNSGKEGALQKDERSIIQRMQLTDWIVALGTVVIAGATIWNVFYVGGQLDQMKGATDDTRNLVNATSDFASAMDRQANSTGQLVNNAANSASSAHDAAKAAQDQASAMGTSLTFAQQSATAAQGSALAAQTALASDQKRLRAYVTQVASGVTDATDANKFLAAVDFKNVGLTPAYDLQIDAAATLLPAQASSSEKIADMPTYAVLIGDMTLSPNAERSIRLPLTPVGSCPDYTFKGPCRIFVIGYLKYADIFGVKHVTRFCHFYASDQSDRDHGQYCRFGNRAD